MATQPMTTSTTTAFALGMLALAPGGGAPTRARCGTGGGGGSRGGGGGGGGRVAVGMAQAFVGGHAAIQAGGGGGGGARRGGGGSAVARRGGRGGGYLGIPSGNSRAEVAWTGSNRIFFGPPYRPALSSSPSPVATMTLKSDTRPASSSGGSSSSGASGVGGGGGGGGGKQRAVRPTGFSSNEEDYKYVAAITDGVLGFMDAVDQSLSGELVVVVTFLPWCRSCHHLRHRLRVLAEAHALAESGTMFYEIDLNANPEVHKMLDIHAAPTVLLYCSGQLVDEFTCAGDSGPRVMLKHIEEQAGSIPDPWHRLPSGPSPESPTPGTTSRAEEGEA